MITSGSYIYLRYAVAGPWIWYECLVLSWVADGEYVIMTPDNDVYIEQCDSQNRNLCGLRIGNAEGTLPFGLSGQTIHRFAPQPSLGEVANLRDEGEHMSQAERLARGLPGLVGGGRLFVNRPPAVVPVPRAPPPPPPVDGAPVAVVPPRRAAPGGTWVLDEPIGDYEVGQVVVLPPGVLIVRDRAFVEVLGIVVSITLVSEDVDLDEWAHRRLGHFLDQDGRVFFSESPIGELSLSHAERLMKGTKREFGGLKGPPTVETFLRGVVQSAGGNMQAGFLSTHDSHEHRIICRAMQLAIDTDRYNIKNSACFEYLNRRRQVIEKAHAEGAGH